MTSSANKKTQQVATVEAKQEAELHAQISEDYGHDRDLANQLLGRIEMAHGISKLTTVVSFVELQKVKESKLYRALKGTPRVLPDGTKIDDVGTWDGFCRALGMSKSTADENLLNLRAFGEDAVNYLDNAGMGYRVLRDLRKKPSDETKALLAELNQEGLSKEEVERQIDKIKEQHKADLAQAQGEAKEAQKNLKASRAVADKQQHEMRQLKEAAEYRKHDPDAWEAEADDYAKKVMLAHSMIIKGLDQLQKLGDSLLDEMTDMEQTEQTYCTGVLLDAIQRSAEQAALAYVDTDQTFGAFAARPANEVIEELAAKAAERETDQLSLLEDGEDFENFDSDAPAVTFAGSGEFQDIEGEDPVKRQIRQEQWMNDMCKAQVVSDQ